MSGKPKIPDSENQKIGARYQAGTDAGILAVEYGVRRDAIYRILAKEKIPRNHKGGCVPTTPEMTAAIIGMYKQKIGSTTIAREFGIDKKTVFNILVRAGVGTRPRSNRTGDEYQVSAGQQRAIDRPRSGHKRGPRLAIDEHTFDTLTSEAAYWLGYLITDGCLHESIVGRSDKLFLRQSREHRCQVEKFRSFLKSNHKITDGTHFSFGKIHEHSVFQATAPYLCSVLKGYGIGARKTGTVSADPRLRENTHFWRGVIDGDGSCYTDRLTMNSSSSRLANQYRRFLIHCFGVSKDEIHVYKNQEGVWGVNIWGPIGSGVTAALFMSASETCRLEDKYQRALVFAKKQPPA